MSSASNSLSFVENGVRKSVYVLLPVHKMTSNNTENSNAISTYFDLATAFTAYQTQQGLPSWPALIASNVTQGKKTHFFHVEKIYMILIFRT